MLLLFLAVSSTAAPAPEPVEGVFALGFPNKIFSGIAGTKLLGKWPSEFEGEIRKAAVKDA
jgi:hypothetical protein